MWLVISLITFIILHIAGPFPSMFKLSVTNKISSMLVITCIVHGFVEEMLFRYCYWKFIPNDRAEKYRTSLVWMNVMIFWMVHILLQYYARHNNHSTQKIYESTNYHLTIIFFAIAMNAVYLESSGNSIFNCIFIHIVALMCWSIFAGGDETDYYEKYKPSPTIEKVKHIFSDFYKQTKLR